MWETCHLDIKMFEKQFPANKTDESYTIRVKSRKKANHFIRFFFKVLVFNLKLGGVDEESSDEINKTVPLSYSVIQ